MRHETKAISYKLNLETLNVQEMNTRELTTVDGGIFGLDDLAALGIALITATVVEVISDWDHLKEGVSAELGI